MTSLFDSQRFLHDGIAGEIPREGAPRLLRDLQTLPFSEFGARALRDVLEGELAEDAPERIILTPGNMATIAFFGDITGVTIHGYGVRPIDLSVESPE